MISVNLAVLAPLQGRKLRLQRRAPEHAEFIQQCRQNQAFMDLYRLTEKRSESLSALRESLAEELTLVPPQLRRFEWVIVRHLPGEAEKLIGLAAVADYQVNHQRAEFLVGIVEPADQQPGIGLEASLLVLDFAFNQLALHKLISFVYGYNPISQENTLALGFTQEGLLREHLHLNSLGYIDLYQNGLLASDFRHNARLSKLSQRLLGYDITRPPTPAQALPKQRLLDLEQALKRLAQAAE